MATVAPPVDPLPVLRPRPGIVGAFGWCLVFLLVTQVPAGLTIVAGIVAEIYRRPLETKVNANGQLVQERRSPSQDELPVLLRSPIVLTAVAVGMGAMHALGITLSILLLRASIGPTWPRVLGLTAPHPIHVVLALAMVPGFVFFSHGIYGWLVQVLPSLSGDQPMLKDFLLATNEWPVWLAVLLIGVGPGIGEELWCRGFLGRGLVARHGWWVGVLWTSFYFGLLHIEPPQAVMAAAMGILLHGAYALTRSLWIPIGLHIANNSLAVFEMRYTPADAPDVPLPFTHWLAALGLLTAVGMALYRMRPRYTPVDADAPVPASAYPTVTEPELCVRTVPVDGPTLVLVGLALAGFGVVVWKF
jgi:membrane protease YdiL (CAAX protease family)